MPRAADYGLRPFDEHLASANDETMVIVHCENRAGLSCIEEIAVTPGVDVIFVGPYDLSQSLGFPGQLDSPQVVMAVERALKAAKKAGKPAGIFVTSEEEACMRLDQGFRYIAYSMDSILFAGTCSRVVKTLKKHMGCKTE
jgi:2,4-dihydroxyhept-2-ene-1,7-dioic acid aldolase